MIDLTEQQEQEMIDRARAGDPEANYNMSLWALEQAMAEPEEERWNRLAAKCLVKAAEGGYPPAQERMKELLAQSRAQARQAAAPAGAPEAAPAAAVERPAAVQAEPAPGGEDPVSKALRAVKSGASKAVQAVGGFVTDIAGRIGGSKSGGSSAGERKPLFNFAEWDAAKRSRVQRIAGVVCLVLVVLIIVMIAKGGRKDKDAEDVSAIPEAETIATPEPVATPEPSDYPPEDIRRSIEEASLDVYPQETEYVTEAKTSTVTTSGGILNLRRGPGTGYAQVAAMNNGTVIDVYAYKNGWALVDFDGTWGWCSVDYLK